MWTRNKVVSLYLSWFFIPCINNRNIAWFRHKNKDLSLQAYEKREKADHWMSIIRVIYAYGMKESTRNNNSDNDSPVRRVFSPFPKSVDQLNRSYCNTKNIEELFSSLFFQTVDHTIKKNLKTAFYKIGFLLNRSKTSNLQKIASEILKVLGDNSDDIPLYHTMKLASLSSYILIISWCNRHKMVFFKK